MMALLFGGFIWYSNRPKSPKPWNTKAIVVKGQPGVFYEDDGKNIVVLFNLTNTTDTDYEIVSSDALKIMSRFPDSLSGPLDQKSTFLQVPVFIPAHQTVSAFLNDSWTFPTRKPGESDADYLKRENADFDASTIAGFVIYDEFNHYEIDLPRWARSDSQKLKP